MPKYFYLLYLSIILKPVKCCNILYCIDFVSFVCAVSLNKEKFEVYGKVASGKKSKEIAKYNTIVQ